MLSGRTNLRLDASRHSCWFMKTAVSMIQVKENKTKTTVPKLALFVLRESDMFYSISWYPWTLNHKSSEFTNISLRNTIFIPRIYAELHFFLHQSRFFRSTCSADRDIHFLYYRSVPPSLTIIPSSFKYWWHCVLSITACNMIPKITWRS